MGSRSSPPSAPSERHRTLLGAILVVGSIVAELACDAVWGRNNKFRPFT